MQHLFFDSGDTLAEVAVAVLGSIGLHDVQQGESVNVLGTEYYSARSLGFVFRLERNAYDYEEQFRFMLSISEDASKDTTYSDRVLEQIALYTQREVSRVLGYSVGLEHGSELVIEPSR